MRKARNGSRRVRLGVLSRIICGVLASVALFVGFLLGSDPIKLSMADEATIAEYHFGSEAMVGHGGWHYRSKQAYMLAGLTQAAILCISAILLLRGAYFASRKPALWGAGLLAAETFYNQIILP